MEHFLQPEALDVFTAEARRAIYDCITLRRDVRHFRPDGQIEPERLSRILEAAHRAPSVGFSQPWAFIVVTAEAQRARIRDNFLKCRAAEAARFPAERQAAYLAHKLEGILESSLNLCVAVDLRDRGEAILGTTAQPEALRASACCAVQNLWLAARAEGVGVGWVSIVEPQVLRHELALPQGVEPIAYLCLGEPVAFRTRPLLEETGWQERAPLSAVTHPDGIFRDSRPKIGESAAAASPAAPACAVSISPVSEEKRAQARLYSSKLAKPQGSLGRLEELGEFYAAAHGVFPPPPLDSAHLLIFAADHGVAVEGVSAYGSEFTAAVLLNVMSGGAAVNSLASECGVHLQLFDVGVASSLDAAPRAPVVPLIARAVRAGTANLMRTPAMSVADAEAALAIGSQAARAAADAGARALGVGEIGIANTTAAAALTAVFCAAQAADVVGGGTGISEATRLHKIAVVEAALALHAPDAHRPLAALAAVGGLEIAAMVGAILGAAERRLPVVLDGFIAQAAALVAVALEPNVTGYLLAAHASAEPGSRLALARLELEPLLDLKLRLGEGTGACLGLALLRSAVALQRNMATFATAGIVGRAGVSGG